MPAAPGTGSPTMYLPGLGGRALLAHRQDVEAGEAHGARAREQEPRDEPRRRLLPERPLVDEQGRGDAERDGVRQRVDLQAEGALRLREPRDAPVEHVEEEGEDEQQRRPVVVVVPLRGRADADGVEPAEHARERDDVRQEKQRLAEIELAGERGGHFSGSLGRQRQSSPRTGRGTSLGASQRERSHDLAEVVRARGRATSPAFRSSGPCAPCAAFASARVAIPGETPYAADADVAQVPRVARPRGHPRHDRRPRERRRPSTFFTASTTSPSKGDAAASPICGPSTTATFGSPMTFSSAARTCAARLAGEDAAVDGRLRGRRQHVVLGRALEHRRHARRAQRRRCRRRPSTARRRRPAARRGAEAIACRSASTYWARPTAARREVRLRLREHARREAVLADPHERARERDDGIADRRRPRGVPPLALHDELERLEDLLGDAHADGARASTKSSVSSVPPPSFSAISASSSSLWFSAATARPAAPPVSSPAVSATMTSRVERRVARARARG